MAEEKKTKADRVKNALAYIATGILITLLVWNFMDQMSTEDPTHGMPPCVTEDSDNCYWDGENNGNGEGRSYTVIDGRVSYWD